MTLAYKEKSNIILKGKQLSWIAQSLVFLWTVKEPLLTVQLHFLVSDRWELPYRVRDSSPKAGLQTNKTKECPKKNPEQGWVAY